VTNEDPTTARRRHGAALTVLLLVSTSALAAVAASPASAGPLGLPDSATTQGDEVANLWVIFLTLAALVTLLIWVLTTYVVVSSIRRRRRGEVDHAASRTEVPLDDPDDVTDDVTDDTTARAGASSTARHRRPAPRQHQYNTRLEIIYTAIPLALVAVLLGLALRTTSILTATTAEPALEVEVTGFQWQWQFSYPQHHVTVSAGNQDAYPTLVLPVGRTVRFRLSADDVIHSFWVPEFLEKRDVIPGVDNTIEVFVKAPGVWVGRCAEYCGFNHWKMRFNVRAVPGAEFDQWVKDSAAKPQPIVELGTR